MRTATATTGARAPDAEDSRGLESGGRRRLLWWLPVAFAGAYALVLLPLLPVIIGHTWWSADSGAAGVVAQLYSHPAAGQFIVLGDHGWYETLGFDLLTRGLPGHETLWYVVPIAVWALTIALVGVSAGRAFGRYGGALAVAALLCLAPEGLMLVFQPTAHTNVVFHAAALAAVSGWVLPRIQALRVPVIIVIGVFIGAFTGLAIAGDAIALVWAVLPFVVATGVCAKRGPIGSTVRTLTFALATLVAALAVTVSLTAVMHSAGIRVDQLVQSMQAQFVKPDALAGNVGQLFNELPYLVGGNFFGHRINSQGLLELVSGGTFLLGGAAVLFALYRSASRAGQRRFRAGGTGVSPRLVHVAFWSTCLIAGLLMFVLSTIGSVDYRYLLGPGVAIAALLPMCADKSADWRIAVAAGVAVLALTGLVRVTTRPVPYLPMVSPLASRDITAVSRFAERHHTSYGYAGYWDAVTITWHSHFAVKLHPVVKCGRRDDLYCPLYQAVSFTAAYKPRPGLRTLLVTDRRFRDVAPPRSWGRPVATEQIGRLTLYAFSYDIAKHFPKPWPGEIKAVITGQLPRRARLIPVPTGPIDHVRR